MNKLSVLPCAFYFKDQEDITLDFGGAVITLHGKIQPFLIDHCRNITIKNVTVEYDRSFYSEFDIQKRKGDQLYVRAKEKFPCHVKNGNLIPYSETWENTTIHADGCLFIQAFEKESREGAGMMVVYLGEEIVEQSSPPVDHILHVRVQEDGENLILTGDFPEHWNENHTIVIAHDIRSFSSAAVYHSCNITFENYRILNGGGMGFLALYTRDITLRQACLSYDANSHGYIANAADGVHFVSCKGKISISDSIFEGTIDDALNIHSNFYQVEHSEKNKLLAYRSNVSHVFPADSDVFGIGDEIAVYCGKSMEEHGRYLVTGAKIIDKCHVELTLDRDTEAFSSGDLIENRSTNAEISIINTKFGKANTHIRLQSRGKILLDHCQTSLPILLTGDADYWFEAGPVQDLTIQNCIFKGERANVRVIPEGFTLTPAAPCYHNGIRLINNHFEHKTPLELQDLSSVLFCQSKP